MIHIRTSATLVTLLLIIFGLAAAAGCQTRPGPHRWSDDYTQAQGLWVHATRQSGGQELRFVTRDDRPDEMRVELRTTWRSPIEGKTVYFQIDGERVEQPMTMERFAQSDRRSGPRLGVGAHRGVGGGFGVGTGVGVDIGPTRTVWVHRGHVELHRAFVERLLEADEVMMRWGARGGPEYSLDAATRQRMQRLLP